MDTRHFEPWIGKYYSRGFQAGRKLLLLGESHYDETGSASAPRYTKETVLDFFVPDGATGKGNNFAGRVTRMLCTQAALTPADALMAWEQCAFANYIPVFVGTYARTPKTREHWELAHKMFPDLLRQLQPDRVLVLGHTVWNRIRYGQWENLKWRVGDEVRGLWRFDVDGKVALATKVWHPSLPRMSAQTMRTVLNALLEA